MKILIFGHIGHISEYTEYIKAFKKVNSVQSLFVTMGGEEYDLGQRIDAFDEVSDILPTDSELYVTEQNLSDATHSLKELEQRLGSIFINRDILMDRYFRGQPMIEVDPKLGPLIWTASRTKIFMHIVSKRLEDEIASFEPDFILLEPVTAPFRMAWRLGREKGVPAGRFMPVRFWPERLYLETGLGYDWEQARIAYNEMPDKPMKGDELANVKRKLQTIIGEKTKPAYMQSEHAKGAVNFIRRLKPRLVFIGLSAWLGARALTCTRNPLVPPGEIFSPIAKYVRYRNGKRGRQFLLKHQTPFHEFRTKRYAIYFLHVQPELTVDGMSFDHQDQVNTLRNILAALPADMHLVVKEHSPMLGFRPLEVYGELVHMPGIILADTQEDSHDLIAHASVVVTLTGTVALEAIMYGIPAIVMGSIYFDCFNGIYKSESLSELKILLSNPDKLAGATEHDALRTLGSLLRASEPGIPPRGDPTKLQQIDPESAKVMMSELLKLG